MEMALYAYVFGVMGIGIGIGFWLQGKLEDTNQIVKLPNAYDVEPQKLHPQRG